MNKRMKVLVSAIILSVALSIVLWSLSNPLRPFVEPLWWGRWHLTREQRHEINQLTVEMRETGATPEEIFNAINEKLSEWGVRQAPGDIEFFYMVQLVISYINLALSICLLIVYIDIYRLSKSDFTVMLLVFSVVLFFYALTANPVMQNLFGFRAIGLGPFVMLPDIFVCAGLSLLLYLGIKY
jgi:hypothetical protein